MPSTVPDFFEILRCLVRHRVNFIIVGGVGAVLQGAPINTFDLDIVHDREGQNIARLLGALGELNAIYRTQPERQLRPSASHLSGSGHNLLITRFGPLDVLGTIGRSRGYAELIDSCAELHIETDIVLRVLDLQTLIEVKVEVGGEKDIAVLPILRRTQEERSRRRTEDG